MSHRRKSSHPLCKQQRINSVVDRVLAAKLQQNETEDDEDYSESVQNQLISDEKIAIPKDLFNDFQALKSATHLDTTQLMRTLIKDYAQLKAAGIVTGDTQPSRPASILSNHSNHSSLSDKDTDKLSEYYRQDQVSHVQSLQKSQNTSSSQRNEPLDLTIVKEEPSDIEDENLSVPPNQILAHHSALPLKNPFLYNMGYGAVHNPHLQTSMRIPTVVQDVVTTSNAEDKRNILATSVHSKSVSGALLSTDQGTTIKSSLFQNSSPEEESPHYKEVQFQNGALQIKGTKSNPKIQLQHNDVVNTPDNLAAQNFIGNFQNLNGGVFVPYQNVTPPIENLMHQENLISPNGQMINNNIYTSTNNEVESNSQSFEENLKAQIEAQQMLQKEAEKKSAKMSRETWNQMHGKRARAVGNNEKETSKEGKNKKGQMKLIAENTSNRGVYTSVLKLPWSRRTRNPKPDASQVNPPSGSTNQVQSPVVLVPVAATGIPNSQGGVFIPTTTWPVQSDATAVTTTSAQPMMMVYPNASFENFGKPVRKRGRPPKVPMIARLLADSAKKKKLDNIPIASFLPNIPTLQQPAIVLNVNNMVNTENTASAVNTVGTNGQTSAEQTSGQPTMSGDPSVGNLVPVIENQPQLQNIAPMPPSNTMQGQGPLLLPKESNHGNIPEKMESIKTIKSEVVTNVIQPQISPPSMELKTMTTTTVANTASGALYQEMILSSKSLVSVKSRRRQTTTELLKSKSHSENFICTSFRLRPVKSGREKKSAAFVPGMRRRGRPPKRRLISSMFENAEIQLDNGETINTSDIREQGHDNINYMNNLIQNTDPSTLHEQMVSQDGSYKIQENVQAGLDSVYGDQSKEFYNAQNNTNNETQEMISTRSFSSDESDNLSFSDMSEGEELHQNQRKSYEKDKQKGRISEKDKQTDQEDAAMFQQLFHCRVCNEIIPVDKKEEHGAKHVKIKYLCNSCGSSYQVFLKDDNMESLLCETCDKNASNHLNRLNVSSKSLICTECGETFSDFSNYNCHIRTVHQSMGAVHQSPNSALDQYHCPLCSLIFRSKTELKTHIKSHKDKIFHCPIENCGKSCITKERMKLHMKIKHQDVTFVRCGYEGCKKKFLNTLHLQEHVRFKHINVKGYKCSWPGCETEFTTERHLKVHLLMHTDEKPLKCDFCDYRCRQGNALNWHVRKHHPEACNQYSVSSGSPESSTPADDAEEIEYTS